MERARSIGADDRTVHVVGGGIAGLVAAISLAERRRRVILHEASARLGGRARSDDGPYRSNVGPHALYRGGAAERWLTERGLLPEMISPSVSAVRIVWGDRMRRVPFALLRMMRDAKTVAPADRDYASWACERLGERGARAATGFAALPTYHADPGRLSAAFVQERIARSMARPAVGYILGGWAALVSGLEKRACQLGVEIALRSKLSERPDGPTIVATDLPAAARILDDPSISWPGSRTAMVDIALRPKRRDPRALLDLERRVYASNYSAYDATLAPEGEALYQIAAGIRDGEDLADTIERIEEVLDIGFRDWRERVTHRRQALSDGGASAADPPGTTWRERPAIDRGDEVALCGDRSAAPGILAEIAFASAQQAAALFSGANE